MTIKAYHGTLKNLAKQIVDDGYKSSVGNAHWLGDGVYFFIDGVGYDPRRAAELWAEYRAKKSHKQFCSLLSSIIDAEDNDVLDLTTYEGIRVLNYIQRKCAQKLAAIGKGIGYVDGYVINYGREEVGLNLTVVKGNEYIQLEQEDRQYNIRRRTPNCTICAVYDKEVILNTIIEKQWRI